MNVKIMVTAPTRNANGGSEAGTLSPPREHLVRFSRIWSGFRGNFAMRKEEEKLQEGADVVARGRVAAKAGARLRGARGFCSMQVPAAES